MHAGIDGRSQQVVGGGDGMDIAGEMQVKVFHGDDLGVAAAGRATLDAKGWSLAGLADAGDDFLIQESAQRLAEANGGRGFAFAQWRRGDGGDQTYLPSGRSAKRSRVSRRTLAFLLP